MTSDNLFLWILANNQFISRKKISSGATASTNNIDPDPAMASTGNSHPVQQEIMPQEHNFAFSSSEKAMISREQEKAIIQNWQYF